MLLKRMFFFIQGALKPIVLRKKLMQNIIFLIFLKYRSKPVFFRYYFQQIDAADFDSKPCRFKKFRPVSSPSFVEAFL